MSRFGNIAPQPHLGYGGQWPSFDSFPSAMLLMIVMATSEQWPSLMRACMVAPPFCGEQAGSLPGDPNDCGEGWVAPVLFFAAYQFLGALLLMNLMVGVVVDEFSSTSIQQNMRVAQMHILEFQEAWMRFDPNGTHYISAHYLPLLLAKLLPPLGVRGGSGSNTKVALLRKLQDAWLPVREGQVQFQEVLFALARCEAGQRLPECALRKKLDRHARRVLDLRHLHNADVLWNAHEYFAAEMLQRTYRGFRAREELHRQQQQEIKRTRVHEAFRISSTLLTSFVTSDASACVSRLEWTAAAVSVVNTPKGHQHASAAGCASDTVLAAPVEMPPSPPSSTHANVCDEQVAPRSPLEQEEATMPSATIEQNDVEDTL
jgi:hypothetical protein